MWTLEAYHAKRRFMRTPEPVGALGASDPEALRFVVQRHASARPHFDLRLELDGLLLSWALPEGPTRDPKSRRLAVETEPHPLDYLTFEGRIPDGAYGAGAMIIWDQGGWVPLGADPAAELAEGALKFRLAGARLTGGFMLKRLAEPPGRSAGGGGDENENGDGGGGRAWLLIKERDAGVRPPEETEAALAEEAGVALAAAAPPPRPGVAAPFPKRVAPQLPSPAPLPPEGPDWAHEIKHDGHRTLAFLQAGAPRFVTRGGLDWTARYGRLAHAFADLDCADAVIDGEVVVQDAKGASSLDLLQQALRAGRDHEFLFFAFDLLHLDGRDLRAEPLALRKSWLRRLAPPNPYARLQYSEHTLGDGRALFAEACRLGLEGVVSKRLGARHQDGRSTGWIKAKRYDVGRFEVVGYTQKTSERFVSALILAEADAETGALRHVGRAGSGLGAEEARRLAAALEPRRAPEAALETPKIAHARWVAPGAMTAEIAYRGRSASGALKQPAVLRVFEAAEGSTPATGGGGAASPPARPRLVSDRDLAAIRLTNPDREILEESGVTKLDVALYYARAGDWILPELLDRPVTLIRNPTGRRGDAFHQRHGFAGLPEGVEAIGPRETQHLVIRTARGFLALPQFGVLEFHPWDARAEDLERPDRLTFDLDPGEGVDWPTVRRAAEELRARLRAGGLTPFPRLTGGAGLHLVVPLAPEAGWAEAARFVKAAAAAAAADAPRLFALSAAKRARVGKIHLDVGRTRRGASSVASYSLRARDGFPAATPITWAELAASGPSKPLFNRQSVLSRIHSLLKDPWADYETARSVITEKAWREAGSKL